MLLSSAQSAWFWRNWSAIIRLNSWDKTTAETQRKALLARAGFDSLTKVTPLDGFDRLKAEFAALTRPADLDAQMHQANMPRTRLIYSIEHSGLPENYLAKVAHGYGTQDWRSFPDATLAKFHLTITNRTRAKRKSPNQRFARLVQPSREAATQDHNPF